MLVGGFATTAMLTEASLRAHSSLDIVHSGEEASLGGVRYANAEPEEELRGRGPWSLSLSR